MIAGGTVLAQMLNTVLSPVITRLYTPDNFGVFTIYTSIISMVAIVGSYKYEMSITIADNKEEAIKSYAISLMTLIFNTLLLTLILSLYGKRILMKFNWDELYEFIYFIPIGLFLIGMYNISRQWALREKEFKNISKTIIRQSLTQNTIKILGGIYIKGPIGLIFGQVLGQCVGILTLSKSVLKERKVFKNLKTNELYETAKRYKHFPIYYAPSQILNASGIHIPVFFVTYLFGSAVTGIFGLANTMINIPFNLIGKSVSDVFYAEAATNGKKDPQRLKKLSHQVFIRLVLIGLVPLITLIILGPRLFVVVFGEEWELAGVFARYIAILVYARFIFMPISRVFEVFEKQKPALFLDIIRFILVVSSFIIAKVFYLDPAVTIGLYSMVMTLVYFITFIVARRILNIEIENIESYRV